MKVDQILGLGPRLGSRNVSTLSCYINTVDIDTHNHKLRENRGGARGRAHSLTHQETCCRWLFCWGRARRASSRGRPSRGAASQETSRASWRAPCAPPSASSPPPAPSHTHYTTGHHVLSCSTKNVVCVHKLLLTKSVKSTPNVLQYKQVYHTQDSVY